MPDASAQCPACGAELDAEASPEGLCPTCLLKSALANSYDAPTVTSPAGARLIEQRVDALITQGQTFGPYRIERLLGKGGMGEVYAAEELDSGRRIALKVLTHGLNEQNRTRFLREGRLAASISHPNTVYVFGTDTVHDIPVIAMELAVGGTLRDRVKAHGPLPPAEAVDAIVQMIAGLQAAAEAGVLHRDIKPSNCFVDRDGTVKVGDFGLSISTLAREEISLTTPGSLLGTPAFASPEQLRGRTLDVRSDIYSVGATLYYLLTGRAPFEEANVLALATMVAQEPAPSPRKLRPETPRGLAALTVKCLAKQPAARVQNYERLTEELAAFRSGTSAPAPVGTRIVAFLIDLLVLVPAAVALDLVVPGANRGGELAYLLVNFGLVEGRWGASIGKAACGLRVHTNDEVPGITKGLVRTILFWSVFVSFVAGTFFLMPSVPESFGSFWPFVLVLAGPLVLFSPARRRNGFAGVHEIVSRTRVTIRAPREARRGGERRLKVTDIRGYRVGPYHVAQDVRIGVVEGYDPRLRRNVWLQMANPDARPVSPVRRDLGRPSRLRWLAGKRSEERGWDAYEAVAGQPFLDGLTRPQAWESVRHWLHALAVELQAGLEDNSLPSLALDKIWL